MGELTKINAGPFVEFLNNVCPSLLGCTKDDMSKHLMGVDVVNFVRQWIADEQNISLFVSRMAVEDVAEKVREVPSSKSETPSEQAVSREYCILVEDQMPDHQRNASTVAFLKRVPASFRGVYEGTSESPDGVPRPGNFVVQLQVLTLDWLDIECSPYEVVDCYLQHAFTPLFSAYNTEVKDDDIKDTELGIPYVQRKIAELSMELHKCQQQVEIEFVRLQVDPLILELFHKAEKNGQVPKIDDCKDLMNEQGFLTTIQGGVSKWQRDIQRVSKLQRDSQSGGAQSEVTFWQSMEGVLNDVYQQLQSPQVQFTLDLLKNGRRFMATMSFESDTGLKAAQDKVTNYLTLLRELPINNLLIASSIDQCTQAVREIFSHMKKIKIATQYPLWRSYHLVEAVSRDLSRQLLKVLSTQRLMQQDTDTFDTVMAACKELFKVWDDEQRLFKETVREQLRRRANNERPPIKLTLEHAHLQDRISELREFRRQHAKLQEVIEKVLSNRQDSSSKHEVISAYRLSEQVDVLDVSRRGQHEWESMMKRYDERIDHVEGKITAKLRDRLGAAKTATEMFRVFSRFNALFVRPRIRSAIHEYQSSLIAQVKEDVQRLQAKFKAGYAGSEAAKMSKLHDIPPVSGLMIWAKQLKNRLQLYMGRVEDVLGRGWEQHVEGRKLKEEGDAFLKKLNTNAIFDDFMKERKEVPSFDSGVRIFAIQQTYNVNRLVVNYDETITTLFKEVRNMTSLKERVPYAVKVQSEEAKQNYQYAMTLHEATRTYMQTCTQIDERMAPMLASYQNSVQQYIAEGMPLKWDNDRIESYTRKLSEQVFQFQQKFHDLESMTEQMNQIIDELDDIDVKFDPQAASLLQECFEKMQKTVDEMCLANFSNVSGLVDELSKRIEQRLLLLLGKVISEWVKQFKRWPANGVSLVQEGAVHELRILNNTLSLDPPKEAAIARWTRHFHDTIGMVLNLPRLQAMRFESLNTRSAAKAGSEEKHQALLRMIDEKIVQDAYETINDMVQNMQTYVSGWLQYQALWEISNSIVLQRLGDDLGKWNAMLTEIKALSARFESSEQQKSFGPIVVDYRLVQSKVKAKYDQWHQDILNEFGEKVQESMTTLYRKVNQGRTDLEKVDGSNGDPTQMTMSVLKVKGNAAEWEKKYEHLERSQKLLDRQRYQFPKDWFPFEQLEGEWTAFGQILSRKTRVLDRDLPKLRNLLIQKEKHIDENVTHLFADWAAQKPVQGNIKPSLAIETIKTFDDQLQKLSTELDQTTEVKKALGMAKGNTEMLTPLREEMNGLKSVWTEIHGMYEHVENMKETPWNAVVPKKIRAALDDLLQSMKNMPPKLRQYEAFDNIQAELQRYLKLNMLVADMKTEALKEQHWKELMQTLKIIKGFNELALGDLWDANLHKHEPFIREVLARAQGELGLLEFMRELTEYWAGFNLELVPYKSKCRLIRGWDDLFNQIDDHLSSLQSMKMSPYYKAFAEQCEMWDGRLNKMRELFDAWMDVQRRWVYLEGIFGTNMDIQALLPNEYARFKTIDSEFVGIMKKVTTKPKALDVMSFEGVHKQLDRLSDMLSTVQKALGDYLEKQRSQFARFYFIGDEDLLEMIGNSRDVTIVNRHLSKMFAGITALTVPEDAPQVLVKMQSKEGEAVAFVKEIRIADDPSINAWLFKVEQQMQQSLGEHLNSAMQEMSQAFTADGQVSEEPFMAWVSKYPCQIMLMAILVDWCQKTEESLSSGGGKAMAAVVPRCEAELTFMAGKVIMDIAKDLRQKLAQMITEVVHHRDVSRHLRDENVATHLDFRWLQLMRMYWNPKESNILQKLTINMADASFFYGFEYLGIVDKLVQTPLTDRCFLTLTQALHMRLGANPFGPAGTGKTESVKALGNTMGRFVLVFNCDEAFDFNAMGRIFIGLCQVGAWGCFDEFNRLEERILSAVSEQVLTIQTGNKQNKKEIEILGKPVRLNPNVGIFVTMNPGYAGRSNLPDNLKQLFRAMAMTQPDKTLIGQVNLFNQGFVSAESLSGKVVFLFDLCKDQLSSQPHYDFGLRSLKAVLACAGSLKREEVFAMGLDTYKRMSEAQVAESEQRILLRSIYDTLVPKLVAQDKPLMSSLLEGVFPGADVGMVSNELLQNAIRRLCDLRHLDCTDTFMLKCMELYQIQKITHGIMLVGTVGTGKSTVWRVLLDAMEKVDSIKGEAFVIDPKAVTKEELYGKLDATTLEWTDGVFTEILRRILMNPRGDLRRQWIMFDGDVDPEWAENLNSVLDDNKLLTLPNGERLAIPPNVRIMFEVETLKYATLATVSRCGMVWFAYDVVLPHMLCSHELKKIKLGNLEDKKPEKEGDGGASQGSQQTKSMCVDVLEPFFSQGGFVLEALKLAEKMDHIMVFTHIRALTSLFSLLRKAINMIIEYNAGHEEFPLSEDIVEKFVSKYLVFSICWSFAGDMHLSLRMNYCSKLGGIVNSVPLPAGLGGDTTLLDFEVRVEDGLWHHWSERVPTLDVEPAKVADSSLIISTVDTVRHTATLAAWLEERRPFILSGPPGSGKTMTLMSTMKSMANSLELASLNFSAGTTPDLLMKTFELYCEFVKTPKGLVMRPLQPGRWVVVFCDECNLPAEDKYGTQHVIMFIRQITEMKGFFRPSDKQWVHVENVQFLGACNPPTDPGRHAMSDRFLRWCPVIWVDYPGPDSLKQIYGTFNRAILKLQPQLPKSMADAMTNVQVYFWRENAKKFTSDWQPHYLYSPRELTRWKTALYEAMGGWSGMTEENLIRLLVHEALRIFVDRLVFDDEREWSNDKIDELVLNEFHCSRSVLQRPILFSTYLDEGLYRPVEREDLREFVQGKLRIFYEEELAVQLVIFDAVLDHIVRMDRVLRQPLGHLLLVGASGAGKTVLSKFVSWMNGLSVYQLKVGRNYDVIQFEADLRVVMKRSGVKAEKITFIFDESNALGPAFVERMNALLAEGEVPGLFEGDEYVNLMSECRAAGMQGVDDAELFARFKKQVQRNLHIVFTMNPANPDFYNRSNSSPALFNRCIIDWFGDWPHEALLQVAVEFTQKMELPEVAMQNPNMDDEMRHNCLANNIVMMHEKVASVNEQLQKAALKYNYVTPRDFLDFVNHFLDFAHMKKTELTEQQQHIDSGLGKLRETEVQVADLQKALAEKENKLKEKTEEMQVKMQQIVQGRQEAAEEEATSKKLSEECKEKSEIINEKKAKIEADINCVEPLMLQAREKIEGVDRRKLAEVQAMRKPPELVEMAIQCVLAMTRPEMKDPPWASMIKAITGGGFFEELKQFESSRLTETLRSRVETKFLNNEKWNVAAIRKVSTPAGDMAEWAECWLKYTKILNKMDPMRQELKSMQTEFDANTEELERQVQNIANATARNAAFEEEYKVLVSDVAKIEQDMKAAVANSKRSAQLLQDLSGEKARWSTSTQGFAELRATLIGDNIITGAFCTFMGFFDLFCRKTLLTEWKAVMQESGIRFKQDLSVIDSMSKPAERLKWKQDQLPDDDISIENAIILERFIRYPLIIDPSGQAVLFISNNFKEQKLVRTSFVDSQFFKQCETSMRFGLPLLVMDVDKIDPILNNVLNKETHKQGPRTLITLGDQDIDLSPDFKLYLCTRDSSVQFTPDICSRVTFVNFTITLSSLASQCMNALLKSERADIDKKRSDQLKLQGEFKVRMRDLEDQLLTALSQVEGSILENTKVLTTLELIKKDSAEIAEKMSEAEAIMAEINMTCQLYDPPGQIAASIFFLLQSMGPLDTFYQFSLAFFFDIFHAAFQLNKQLEPLKDNYSERLKVIIKKLFFDTFQKVGLGLQECDIIVFGLRLAQIMTEPTEPLNQANLDLLLKGAAAAPPQQLASQCEGALRGGLNALQTKALQELHTCPDFAGLISDIRSNENAWITFLHHLEPEANIPAGWRALGVEVGPANRVLQDTLILKALRMDRVGFSCTKLVETVLGEGFLNLPAFSLADILAKDSKASAPIMMVSVPGFDPSGKVSDLALQRNQQLLSTAMGTKDGFKVADDGIAKACKTGGWVMLKNVHLAVEWLSDFEKKLYTMNPHQNFRLFLTMEFNPKIPANLIRLSRVYVFEPPSGVKASLQRSFAQILPKEKTDKQPTERARLHFLLGIFHAVVLERIRYCPVGWSKKYEFSDADQNCARDVIDNWLDSVTNNGQVSNVSPEKIPWGAIQAILSQAIYGGRIDNAFDQGVLDSFIRHLFNAESFDSDFPLNLCDDAEHRLLSPDGRRRDQFTAWVDALPVKGSPAWVGLPVHAEQMLRINMSQRILARWLTLSGSTVAAPKADKQSGKRASIKNPLADLGVRVASILENLPEDVPTLQRTSTSLNDPLWRCFDREMGFGRQLLTTIRANLRKLLSCCKGEIKATNDLRQLIQDMNQDAVPKQWNKFTIAPISVTEWLQDFTKRVKQLEALHACPDFQDFELWFGGLFFPEAFLTASRQAVAQKMKVSLEELLLVTDIGAEGRDSQSFIVKGLYMEGADWDTKGELKSTDELSAALPNTRLKWAHRTSDEYKQTEGYLKLPLYLNTTRANIVESVKLRPPPAIKTSTWIQRGACLTLWTKT